MSPLDHCPVRRFLVGTHASPPARTEVVIPSVGYAVRLPANHLADWYREMLKEDDLTMDNLDPKHKSFAVSGAYRPLLLRPKNLTCKVAYYTDPFKSLAISDLDKLNGIDESTFELDTNATSHNGNLTEMSSNDAENNQSNGSTSLLLKKELVAETGEETKMSSISSDNVEHLPVAEEENEQSVKEEDGVAQLKPSSLSDTGNDKKQEDISCEDTAPEPPVTEAASIKNESSCSDDANGTVAAEDTAPEPPVTEAASIKNESSCSDDANGTVAAEALCDGTEASAAPPPADAEQKAEDSTPAVPSAPQRLKAVVLQFSLPPAGYATMVLRELLKIDTGSQFHASLNSSHAFGDRGRGVSGGYRGAGRGGDRGRNDRGRGNWTSHRGDRGFRGGDRSNRGGRGRGFHSSRGDHNKRSFSGQRSDRGGNKRPRY